MDHKLLKQLCSLNGVSGWEDDVRSFLEEKALPYADQIQVDALGNLLVLKKGLSKNKIQMLIAHMDESGFLIRTFEENGCLRIGIVGAMDPRTILGKRVHVGAKSIPGVVGLRAPHLTPKEQREKIPDIRDCYLDIGAQSREEAKAMVGYGEPVAFACDPEEMSGGIIKAKALDGRSGCAILLELLKLQVHYDTWFVFSVQGHCGGIGLQTAVQAVRPDQIILLDSAAADRDEDFLPGNGCAAVRMYGKIVSDSRLLADFEQKVEKLNCLASVKAPMGEASVPAPSLSLCIPMMNPSAPTGILAWRDLKAVGKLLQRYLQSA